MPERTLTLIAYDITAQQRRAKALKAVRAFGLDGQKSVHECALTRTERRELHARLQRIIDPETDRLLIIRLDPRGSIRALTETKPVIPSDILYVG